MIRTIVRYPVKSMLGEALPAARLTERGLEGDRTRAVVDVETGMVGSAKAPRRWGALLRIRAVLADGPDGPVTLTLPGGRTVRSDDEGVDGELSAVVGRPVRLASRPPPQASIERLDVTDDGEVTDVAQLNVLGRGAPQGTFFDFSPLHVVTVATLARLAEGAPPGRFAAARFRPNVVVDLPAAGAFAENGWAGRTVRLGAEVVLRGQAPTPRCVVTTLAQGAHLPQDRGVLRDIAARNRVPMEGGGSAPCVGSYFEVVRGGTIRPGDPVVVEGP